MKLITMAVATGAIIIDVGPSSAKYDSDVGSRIT